MASTQEPKQASTAENTAQNTAESSKEVAQSKENVDPKHEKKSAENSTDDPGFFLAPKGNALGNKIESGLSPVGKPVGKGLETISRPVGGLVEPLVGGLLRSGGAYGNNAGVGAGNMEHKKAEEKREQEREKEERHAPVGGQEQTGQNPLGLSNP